MQARPYTYHNNHFILKPWVVDFIFDTECITIVPLWVNLPGLPVGCQTVEALSKVSSVVEVDISHPLQDTIITDIPFGTIQQKVEYDWRLKFYSDCIRFGHLDEECWLKKKVPAQEKKQDQEREFKKPPKRRRRGQKEKEIYANMASSTK